MLKEWLRKLLIKEEHKIIVFDADYSRKAYLEAHLYIIWHPKCVEGYNFKRLGVL